MMGRGRLLTIQNGVVTVDDFREHNHVLRMAGKGTVGGGGRLLTIKNGVVTVDVCNDQIYIMCMTGTGTVWGGEGDNGPFRTVPWQTVVAILEPEYRIFISIRYILDLIRLTFD
jgi:hypothetical protein